MRRLASGKVEFAHIGQTFMDVTESSANVHYIGNAIQRKWGNDYILVTGDGLQIEDSCGTQGRCTIGSYGSMQSLRAKLA